MTISFERRQREATFKDPREDFETVSIPVEHRIDPLTNRSSRLVTSAIPWMEESSDLDSFLTDDTNCVFCPDMVSSVTPQFVDEHDEKHEGHGETMCFPNLNPYAEESLVVVLTEDHHLSIDELTSEILFDGFRTAWDALEPLEPGTEDRSFKSINMNFYPPSGSSIVHPHLHGIADDVGSTEYRRFVEGSRAYRNEHSQSYWRTLVETERETDERYITRDGGIDWIAAFAPKHFDHVFGVIDRSETPDDAAMFEAVADGIENILKHYDDSDFNSFNISLYLPDGEHDMPPIVQIVARTPFNTHYSTGVMFMQIMHKEGLVEVAPETYADQIRTYF